LNAYSKEESDHFIKGTIQGGKLTYKGLRYFPANPDRMDLTHESGSITVLAGHV